MTSRSDASALATAPLEAQAANVLIEPEFGIGEESGTSQGTSLAAAAVQASLDDLWVFSIPTRTIHWRIRGDWWLGAILTAAWPLILNGLLTLIYGRIALHTAKAWVWLLIFTLTQVGALLAARGLWGRVVRDMPIIAMMMPDEGSDRKLAAWIRSWFAVPLQAIAGFALSGLGAFVLWLASPAVGRYLELGPISYVSVAWTSFMGGLVLYTLAMATLMTFKIQKCGPLILDLWDPANTPGLRTLSRGYVY